MPYIRYPRTGNMIDFSYQGAECGTVPGARFKLLEDDHYILEWGPLPQASAIELFVVWQSNFITGVTPQLPVQQEFR